MAAKLPLLYLGSVVLVLMQILTASAVWIGTILPSCFNTYQCDKGFWCRLGTANRCSFCGEWQPLPAQYEGQCRFGSTGNGVNTVENYLTIADPDCTNYNNPFDSNFVGFNMTLVKLVCTAPSARENINGDMLTAAAVQSWCEQCVHPVDWSVDSITGHQYRLDALAAMGFLDNAAFVLAMVMVVCTIIGEKDIELCTLAIQQAGEKISTGWVRALTLIGGARRWAFLPILCMNIPTLIVHGGGDALSVCMNTVAILFMTDIDNLVFQFGLAEKARSRVEDAGRVELSESDAMALAHTKIIHSILLAVALLGGIWSAALGASTFAILFLPFPAFWIGGVLEVLNKEGTTGKKLRRLVNLLAAFIGGPICVMLTMSTASGD